MSEITLNFTFEGEKKEIKCKKDEYIKDIFSNYCLKISKNIKDIFFLYKGNTIDIEDKELKLKDINNTDNEIQILVFESSDPQVITHIKNNKKKNFIKCIQCGEMCVININNYKIFLNNCEKNHKCSNILLEEYYNKVQKKNESETVCNNCKKIISIEQDIFYICGDCNINLCLQCKSNHNKDHIIIDYDLKNYKCIIHGEKYNSYCKDCNKNLCDMCQDSNEHTFIYNRQILPNKEMENNLIELRKSINEYKENTNEILNIINKTIDYLEKYYKLSRKI